MRQLYSAFPDGWPAAGLVLLRLILGGSLIANATSSLHAAELSQLFPAAIDILTGVLVIVGLWTPIVGIIACLSQLALVLTIDGIGELPLLRASVGLSLALLGPGGWSVDARLFGRRRVEIKHLGGE